MSDFRHYCRAFPIIFGLMVLLEYFVPPKYGGFERTVIRFFASLTFTMYYIGYIHPAWIAWRERKNEQGSGHGARR